MVTRWAGRTGQHTGRLETRKSMNRETKEEGKAVLIRTGSDLHFVCLHVPTVDLFRLNRLLGSASVDQESSLHVNELLLLLCG